MYYSVYKEESIGKIICRLVDILSHIMKINITTPTNKIIDPIYGITFHAV